jgi:PAS domain S-box-containing protein
MLAFRQDSDGGIEAERLAQAVVETLPHEVAVVDGRGFVIQVNARWARRDAWLTGSVRGLSPGDHALEILRAAASEGDHVALRLADGIEDVLGGDASVTIDYPVETEGRTRWFSLDLRRMADSLHGVLLCRSDISAQTLRFATALAASERRERRRAAELQAVFDAAPIGLALALDPKGERISGNPALEALVGSPRGGELSKASLSSTLYRVFRQGREARTGDLPMQRAVRGEVVRDDVLEIVDRDGRRRTALATARPLYDESGELTGAVGAFVDITRLRHVEEALRAGEMRYRALFEKMDEGFCIVEALFDPQGRVVDCRFLEANPAFSKHTGLGDPVGRTMVELGADPGSPWFDLFGEVVGTGRSTRVERYAAALGRHLDACAFPADSPGSHRVAVLFTDVTARREADARLRESEAQFRAIFELTGVGMAHAEISTRRIVRVNDTLAQMLGYSRDELVGTPFPALTHPDDREADIRRFERMARGQSGVYQSEKRYMRKDGTIFCGHVTGTLTGPFDNPDARTVAVIQDISERKSIETQLRESEARLEQALEAANAGVWELSLSGAFEASPRARALFGAPADAPMDRDAALSAVAAEDRGRFAAALAQALQFRQPLDVEMRIRRSDGSWRWVEAVAEPRGEHDSLRLVGLVQDIDEMKGKEIALRESEFRLKLALDSGNIGIYEWRLPANEFIWDDRLLARWGLPPDQPMSYDMFVAGVHPEDRPRVVAEIDQAIDPAAGGAFRSEFRVLGRADEVERWMAVTGTAFFEDGRVIRMVGTAQDITARKRAEIERQKFVSLAEQSVEFIGICNLAFEPLYINPAGARLVGLEGPGANLQIRVEDFFFPEDRAFIFAEFFPKVLREGSGNVEIRFRHFGSGEAVWMLYNVFLMRDPFGAPIGLATVSRDITQKRKVESALKEADQRKDEFLATLAHELRNPLAPIRTATYVLCHGAAAADLSPRAAELLSMIDRQSAHLVRLVDDLLEVSRITRGKIELRKERVDLNRILRHAVETAQPTILAGGHRLDVRLPQRPAMLAADPVRLAQVFTNLLNNAAKYTEQGGAIALVAEVSGDEAVVTVRDSGVGIPAEMLPHVFDLFTQIDRTLGRAQGGLGIGLALVKRLVELHGGEVEAHSDGLGRGSAFTVRLRLIAEDGAKAPMSNNASNNLSVSRRILVIDDDHDVADSLVMFLETFGADVRVAYSGESGVAAVRDFRPELVFLDLGMPKMDGYETARQIRALPEGRDVKLVALTGWGQGQIRERAHDAGFDCQLTKPAGIDALQALLNAV